MKKFDPGIAIVGLLMGIAILAGLLGVVGVIKF